MANFLKTASKQVGDVRDFLREAAGGNGIKYTPEKGCRHTLYFPFNTQTITDEAGNVATAKTIIAISGAVHEWTTPDNKFKATVCLKDVVRKGEDGSVINDGSCPFCDRISNAWDIYNYRKELEEVNCKLTGEQRKNHLETTFGVFRDERKAKETRTYMYVLVVKFKLNEQGKEVVGKDGLPEFDLKVMKLSASRVEKIQQQVSNSGSDLAGSELIFDYPSVDDRRLLVSQSTTTPVFPNNMITARYPAVVDRIAEAVAKFDWEGIEKSFPEWGGMTSTEAKSTCDAMFAQWDEYTAAKKVDPNAKYLEYVVATPTANPSLEGAGVSGALPMTGVPQVPNVPNIPNVPNVAAPTVAVPNMAAPTVEVPQVPNVAPASEPVVAPPVAPDPNAVFGGAGAQAPSISI